MPVVRNDEAREIPWRPGYRNYILAGEAQGVSVSSSMAVLEQGAGAPLHFHEEVDEVIVVLEGTLDVRIGDERVVVGKDQTISVPARTPHAFTVVSPEGARFIAFLPKQGAHMATRYLEGAPPAGANLK
ncbi:MAG: cupin domain-containing protein [Alphaproteobacteria bacterium]|nr:cupin domain-containing protein [Alphaproteobacteria bacterium]MBV8409541.1 cupin domain-containing protein [Alphaproteobacteria bacterium]